MTTPVSPLATRVTGFGQTVFSEMTALAEAHGAINLGQGFPDFAAPEFLKDAARAAIAADVNQYAPAPGRLRLRRAIAAAVARQQGLVVDPERQVVVTNGATEALFAGMMAFVEPGAEVILFEPTYDAYVPAVRMAGGVPRVYTLHPPDWRLDMTRIAALFTPKTRLLLLNTPHNPTGKVFTEAELAALAELCRRHDVLVMADEVYEHIIFDGVRHISMAALPGMAERTVTISSLGKTFSATGWKVGWAHGPEVLIAGMLRAHQFITFCGAAPLQEAAAVGLESAANTDFYAGLAQDYQARRDTLASALAVSGLRPIKPEGTYFVMAQIDGLGWGDDVAFCRRLVTEFGVAAIPPSAFYLNPADGQALVRFAFCKRRETLAEAARRLAGLGLKSQLRE